MSSVLVSQYVDDDDDYAEHMTVKAHMSGYSIPSLCLWQLSWILYNFFAYRGDHK